MEKLTSAVPTIVAHDFRSKGKFAERQLTLSFLVRWTRSVADRLEGVRAGLAGRELHHADVVVRLAVGRADRPEVTVALVLADLCKKDHGFVTL